MGFLKALLSRRDWVYSLSLLIPFVAYNLTLKAISVLSQPGDQGLARTLDLMRSDVFFDLGYVLFWIGLFAATRRGPLRWAGIFLFHTMTMLVVVVNTCAHQYFLQNGTTLDYGTIAEWIPKFGEIEPILFHDIPLWAWGLLAAALFYAAFGPLLVTRAVERWKGRPESSPAKRTRLLGPLTLWVLALGFGSLSLLVGSGPADIGKSFARDQFVNVVLTGIAEATAADVPTAEADSNDVAHPAVGHPAANASLAPTSGTQKRNVVLIHLESTRAESVTPYNEALNTTPFLDELAQQSLLVDRAYALLPRTSKAEVAVNCGVEPPLYPGPEFEPGGVPARCLPNLLKEQGYRTAIFQSTNNAMDNFGDVVKNFGYDDDYPLESLDTTGFKRTNTFGYEDDIMLKPSEEWLGTHKDEPFVAEYFTGTGHYGYECVPNRYGTQDFSEDTQLNSYHNCLNYLDHFVKNLIDQYKALGLYENTIFVIYGDHGEGFGEHGRYLHGDTIWEEGLRIPLMVHAPGLTDGGERVEGLSNQTDILPTVVEMLGYKVQNGEYPGYSLLHPLPKDRVLDFSCISERKCLASIKGNEKYIYHYDNQPDEVFDLSKDPSEKNNLADGYSKEELDKRREDLLAWRSTVNGEYGGG